ncbi:MAG: phytanoyl-CoA dioxygenase family protein [Catenulisporales bacterium]|nr:phytanoyl-CoA dioxygenase family protein [Catenulisporales bacterium]
MLSEQEIEGFIIDGFVAVRQAVPADVAGACADRVWSELASRGVRREDPSTWTEPVVRLACPEDGPFVEAGQGVSRPLWEACDQLLGPGRWWRRRGVGGSIPVRFPSDRDPGDTGWHLDGGYEDPADGGRRVTVRGLGGGLLALFLFSDVDQDSAPTRLRAGSHLDTARVLAAAGERGLEWGEAARAADRASAHREIVLATGRAGDVFLCHQLMVHAASWPHRGRVPRIVAQPLVALLGEYRLPGVQEVARTPVEEAVLRAVEPLPGG